MKPLDKDDILYCDNHVLVVDKPAEIPTQPDLVELAKDWVKKEYKKPGKVFLEPIHRLDKPVAGIVLFARTSKALSRMQAMMRERQIRKTYLAWVEGSPPKSQDTLTHFLVHGSFRALVQKNGKESILHYKVLERRPKATLVEIILETGRYHQIRVQLSTTGCPVWGDKKYGSTKSYPIGIALSHIRMELKHPVTGALLDFKRDRKLLPAST